MSKGESLLKILPLLSLLLIVSGCAKEVVGPKIVEQFLKIHFHYDFANELNTFDQTYTKDLVMDGTTTVSFWLTESEQHCILEKV